MSERRTITGTMTAGDATARATSVAEALRAAGKTVTIGAEYEDVTVKRYGLRSVDILIDDAPAPQEEAVVTETTVSPQPEPAPEAPAEPAAEESPKDSTEEEPEFVPDQDDPDVPA